MNVKTLREKLSSYAHAAWAGWMIYLFAKSHHNPDGSVTIPADQVERWKRQVETEYPTLTENEKKSDQKEADDILNIVGNHILKGE